MRKKEIEKKFEKLEGQIDSLKTVQKDHHDTIEFLLSIVKKYSDEPIFRTKLNDNWHRSYHIQEYILQYAYKNSIMEITTTKPILYAELYAYCDTHFILKSTGDEYFLINMAEKTISDIPVQLLFSKKMNLSALMR